MYISRHNDSYWVGGMKPLPLTEVGVLGPFVDFLDEMGAPVNRALDQNHLSREMVDRGHGKVSKLQFYQFLERAGPGSGLPDLGFRVGHHYGMRFAGPVRRELGVPTVFNFLGPLVNPARAERQVIGVADARMAERMIGVLQRLGR